MISDPFGSFYFINNSFILTKSCWFKFIFIEVKNIAITLVECLLRRQKTAV